MKSRGLVGRKRIVLLLGMAVSMLGSSPTTAQPSLPAISLKAPLTISPHAAISNVTLLLENDNANGAVFGGLATNTGGFGIVGLASDTSSANFGVAGATQSAAGTGVYGLALSSTCPFVTLPLGRGQTCVGVIGQSVATSGTTAGVVGLTQSPSGAGVIGQAGSTSCPSPPLPINLSASCYGVFGLSPSGAGVAGVTTATSGQTYGVFGENNSPNGAAIFGFASSGFAGKFQGDVNINCLPVELSTTCLTVFGNGARVAIGTIAPVAMLHVVGDGTSGESAEVYGESLDTTGPTVGVQGRTNSPRGTAISGQGLGGGFAGNFVGPVQINGNLTVNGNSLVTGTKSALVGTESYGKRQLYAVESPQNWFEDFGSAELINGHALITLDPIFAQTVNTKDEYHIFLTPKGDCKGLYVAHQRATSFEVKELQNGKSNVAFDYRIVAKRKGYERVRLPEPAR